MADDTRVTHARRGIARALPFACLIFAAVVSTASADVRIIVKHEPGLTRAERGDTRHDAGVSFDGALAVPGTEVVSVPTAGRSAALRALNADPDVEYAEPAATYRALSDDERFDEQWALENTGQQIWRKTGIVGADMAVTGAWQVTYGAGQTVAVVDTGVDAAQPDLQGRIALGGRSFVAGVATSGDDQGHGTAVAGVIAANHDNGEGIAGVAPEALVLPLKALDSSGGGSSVAIGDAFEQAGALGVRVVNASIGGKTYSQYMRDAIARHPNTLYVVPAGNGEDYGSWFDGDDNDSEAGPEYPCNFPEPNVLCVGSTDNQDAVTPESNWGAVSVDLFAPGWRILTISLQDPSGYAAENGSSMAAAMVSGEAALVLGAHPNLTAASVKWLILASVDPIDDAAGRSVSGGRADALAAVTTPVIDSDGDGALDVIDNCVLAANATQADADADGTGDPCDPMPRGSDQDGDGRPALDDRCPTVPAATADGCPPPTNTPASGGPSPPQLVALKVLSLTVKLTPATCPRGVACRRSAKIGVRLSRTAKVALRVERKVRGRWTRVYARTLNVTTAGRVVIAKGPGGRTLANGSYRVSATPTGVKATTRSFRVR
jgi:subtilisin family serine protease